MRKGLIEKAGDIKSETTERERKIVLDGTLVYSFGKNGQGLSDEFIQIGNLINQLSKDNHIYLEESFIDACDDVYDLKFKITPHEDNKWMIEKKFENG